METGAVEKSFNNFLDKEKIRSMKKDKKKTGHKCSFLGQRIPQYV